MTARTRVTRVQCAAATFIAVLVLAVPAAMPRAATGEVTDRSALRVCVDPANMPFSNDKGEGFENKIAELIAEELGVPLEYTWYPQSVGFVRNTLAARRCDLVIGVAATNEMMQNSNPYYRSAYAMVHRPGADVGKGGLQSPKLSDKKIGVIARTPPVTVLAQRALLENVRAYPLVVDTRNESPAQRMIADVASGEIDVGLLWGPMAGYWATRGDPPLVVEPLAPDAKGPRMDFRISMGMRYNEPDWKHRINAVLAKRKAEIEGILSDYGVPLLDDSGALITPARATAGATKVPEPASYRTGNFRAPVPATLKGAEVVDVAGLNALMRERPFVLIDVFAPPRGQGKPGVDAPRRPSTRETLIGGVWLPKTGLGTLTEDLETYFERALAELSGRGRDKALIFYGEPNCWMSWNAAKRAVALGYEHVYWFPDGVQGWRAARGAVMEVGPWSAAGLQRN